MDHYCPVKWSTPSERTSTGAACRLILFGVDLNFSCRKPRTFPGLTFPRNWYVCWQDPVRPGHGVRAVDELHRHRGSGIEATRAGARCRAPSSFVLWPSRSSLGARACAISRSAGRPTPPSCTRWVFARRSSAPHWPTPTNRERLLQRRDCSFRPAPDIGHDRPESAVTIDRNTQLKNVGTLLMDNKQIRYPQKHLSRHTHDHTAAPN